MSILPHQQDWSPEFLSIWKQHVPGERKIHHFSYEKPKARRIDIYIKKAIQKQKLNAWRKKREDEKRKNEEAEQKDSETPKKKRKLAVDDAKEPEPPKPKVVDPAIQEADKKQLEELDEKLMLLKNDKHEAFSRLRNTCVQESKEEKKRMETLTRTKIKKQRRIDEFRKILVNHRPHLVQAFDVLLQKRMGTEIETSTATISSPSNSKEKKFKSESQPGNKPFSSHSLLQRRFLQPKPRPNFNSSLRNESLIDKKALKHSGSQDRDVDMT